MHRSLGVHLSFVRSVTMDSWSDKELEVMRVGGNRAMRDFFTSQSFPPSLTIEQKYSSEAAALYRERIRTLSEGGQPKPIPKVGWKEEAAPLAASSMKKSSSMQGTGSSSMRGGGSSGSGGLDDDDDSFSFTSTRPKMQMQGFGSSPSPAPPSSSSSNSSSDWFNSLTTVLSTTAQMTTKAAGEAATLVASKSKEAATLIAHKSTDAAHTLSSKDIGGTVAHTWGGLTSLVGSAYSQVVTGVAGAGSDDGDGLGELKSRVGGGGAGGAKYEGMSSEAFTGFGGDGGEEGEGKARQQQQLADAKGVRKGQSAGVGGSRETGWGGWEQDDAKVNAKPPPSSRTSNSISNPNLASSSSSSSSPLKPSPVPLRADPLPSVDGDGGFGGWDEVSDEVAEVEVAPIQAMKALGLSVSRGKDSASPSPSPGQAQVQEHGKRGEAAASAGGKKVLVSAAPLEDNEEESGWDNDW